MLLSFALWESRYSQDPAVIGSTICVNDAPAVIVGVMPRGVTFPGASNLWMPLVRTSELQRRDARNLTIFGPLASTATLGAARRN